MSKPKPTPSAPEARSEAAAAEETTEDYPVKYKFDCAEINKRSVGKFILKCCGNEGVSDEEDNRLRRLLQGAITHLENEDNEVWTNAELTIYDKYADCYIMKAGEGEFKFLVHLDGRDEIEVICTERPSRLKKKLMGAASYFNPFNWSIFKSGSGKTGDAGGNGDGASDKTQEKSEPKPTEQSTREPKGNL